MLQATSAVIRATPERFEIVKRFYIEADNYTGYGAAADVIVRAMTYLDRSTLVAELGGQPPAALSAGATGPRDLSRDLDAVPGNERVPATSRRAFANSRPTTRPIEE